MPKRTIPFLIILFLSIQAMPAYPQDQLDQEGEKLKTHARVDWCGVTAPIDKLLLVKKDKDICAIRFTEFHRGHDAKAGTVFHSGEETLIAHYEWFYQTDGSGDFKKRNITNGSGKLVRKPLKGIGRLAFQTGNDQIKAGPFKLFWGFPSSVSFSSTPACSGSGVALCPTKWVSIEDINTSLPTLKWYYCDEHRKTVYVPFDEL